MKPSLILLVLAATLVLAPASAPAVDLTGWGGNVLYHDGLGAQLRNDLWTDEEFLLLSGQLGFLLQNERDEVRCPALDRMRLERWMAGLG